MKTEEEIKEMIEKREKTVGKMQEKPMKSWGNYSTNKCFACRKIAAEKIADLEIEDNIRGQIIALYWVLGEYKFYGGKEHD